MNLNGSRFYTFDKNIYEGVANVVTAVIKKYIAKYPYTSIRRLESTFPEALVNNDTETQIELSNGDVVNIKQEWNKESFDLFVRHAKELGFIIKDLDIELENYKKSKSEEKIPYSFGFTYTTNFITNIKPEDLSPQEEKLSIKIFKYLDRLNIKESEVQRKAGLSRQTFSKVITNSAASKDTIIQLGIGLELSLDELEDLFRSVDFSLNRNNRRDLVIEYFFKEHIYDLKDINQYLLANNMDPLGNKVIE